MAFPEPGSIPRPERRLMFELISKALLALVLDKDAREKLDAAKAAGKNRAAPPTPAAEAKSQVAPRPVASARPAMTDTKQELIRKALEVQRSKQHVFDELSDEAKAKILIAAVKAFNIPPDQIERSLTGKPARPRDKG